MESERPLFNTGIHILNPLDTPLAKATIVVTGPARSGTTMLTQLLINMGFNMGEELDSNLLEDIEIRHAIRDRDPGRLKKIIKERNKTFPIWGWKYPATMEYIDFLGKELRNPIFIFCVRDPVATTTRNQMAGANDFLSAMQDALNYLGSAIAFTGKNHFPTLFFSYEKALLFPDNLVTALGQFLRVDLDEGRVAELSGVVSLNNTRYKLAGEASKFKGVIDRASWNQIGGWAYQEGREDPVELELWVDLKCVKRFTAGGFRPGLKEHGIGNGKHAFSFDLSPYLAKGVPHRVEVKHAVADFPLAKSPVMVYPE